MADPKDERDPTTYPTTYPTTHPTYDPNRDAFIHMFRRAEDRADFDGSLREEGRRINRETDQERAARLVENAGQDNPHLLGDVPPTPPRRLAAAAAVMQLPVRPWGRRIALPQEPAGPSSLHVFLDNYEQKQLAQQQLAQQQLAQQQLEQQQLEQQQQQDDPIEASPPPKWRPRIQRLQGEDPKDPIVDSGGGKRKTKKLKRLKRLKRSTKITTAKKSNKRNNRRIRRSRSRSRSKKSYSY